MIRGIFFWIVITSFSLAFATLVIAISPLFVWYKKGQEFLHHLARWWGQSILLAIPGIRVKVLSQDNSYKTSGPVVFVSNHASNFDVLAVCFLNANFRWLSKDTLFKLPLVGWAMRIVGYVPVVRTNAMSRAKCMEDSKAHLLNGVSMFFFPEGTRSRTGQLGNFKLGAFRLAKEVGAPVVPIAIKGAREVCPSGSFVVNPGSITLTIGSPLDSREVTADQLAQKAHSAIQKLLKD